ncbi:uncharacterized protein PGTG_10561 [Puccinia graminis f. sp. tritici CRL 75-36-700-3]|uniref:Uncharacterized protein n=1 Tax=Puccinia graminis f. sp. tritici (strain CRL 75-36-700-3 / race SCCL) TaxID=418459 RepID=E3KIQ8_PUCGT|nr:uncharacterized protein PGTG_10561 [Puccinia graminis f. sp. tritici CRL 75-36-700-3]EFP84183.1 hypothetical protein PGTG_10561 [Puccinia graminis f. sp. tritici CRL 75-36-700-3]
MADKHSAGMVKSTFAGGMYGVPHCTCHQASITHPKSCDDIFRVHMVDGLQDLQSRPLSKQPPRTSRVLIRTCPPPPGRSTRSSCPPDAGENPGIWSSRVFGLGRLAVDSIWIM